MKASALCGACLHDQDFAQSRSGLVERQSKWMAEMEPTRREPNSGLRSEFLGQAGARIWVAVSVSDLRCKLQRLPAIFADRPR
jgi:hypothetical protein